MKTLKRLIGYISIILGLLLSILCIVLTVLTLMNKLEITSNDQIIYCIGFLIYFIIGIAIFFIGRNTVKKYKKEKVISEDIEDTDNNEDNDYIYLSDIKNTSKYIVLDTKTWIPYSVNKDNIKTALTWLEVEELSNKECRELLDNSCYKNYRHLVYTYDIDNNGLKITYRVDKEHVMNVELYRKGINYVLKNYTDHSDIKEYSVSHSRDIKTKELKHYIIKLLKQYIDMNIPLLSSAKETGSIGKGETISEGISNGQIVITNKSTDLVQYYYFDNGTLVFAGHGATKAVAFGGYDGNVAYAQEESPFSKEIIENTKKLIVLNGITTIGSGLLTSLKGLEEIILYDSVENIKYNILENLKVLKTGLLFKAYGGYGSHLTHLELPSTIVHLPYHNNGNEPGISSDNKEIQTLIFKKLVQEYEFEMSLLYRDHQDLIEQLSYIPYFDNIEAQKSLFSLNWNSLYKKTRHIPVTDLLDFIHIDSKEEYLDILELEVHKETKKHSFLLHGAILYATTIKHPKKIILKTDYEISEGLLYWYKAVYKDIEIIINDTPLNELVLPVLKTNKQTGEWQYYSYTYPKTYKQEYTIQCIDYLISYILEPMTLVSAKLGKKETEHIHEYKDHKDLYTIISKTDIAGIGGLNKKEEHMKFYFYNTSNEIDIFTSKQTHTHFIILVLLYYKMSMNDSL